MGYYTLHYPGYFVLLCRNSYTVCVQFTGAPGAAAPVRAGLIMGVCPIIMGGIMGAPGPAVEAWWGEGEGRRGTTG